MFFLEFIEGIKRERERQRILKRDEPVITKCLSEACANLATGEYHYSEFGEIDTESNVGGYKCMISVSSKVWVFVGYGDNIWYDPLVHVSYDIETGKFAKGKQLGKKNAIPYIQNIIRLDRLGFLK